MRTFATILDNPGEPPAETRYRDVNTLRDLGYSDLIIYETTGISGMLEPSSVSSVEMRRWIHDRCDLIDNQIQQADKAGLKVWLTIDAPSLIHELVGSAMTCVNQPHILCPGSNELLDMMQECLEAMLSRFDHVTGFVLRLGDTDGHRIPYMIGNDIYTTHCARCSGLNREDRLVKWITAYYEQVVKKHNRELIVRAWNVRPGGMHDHPAICKEVMKNLPVDDKLIFSFKFTQTDFWRYQKWNQASLECGDRPVIYELQCQREFEGKGALPSYQPALWREGMNECENAQGLADISEKVNVAGLWAWVRGGGWGGPYVTNSNEQWIEANVCAVPLLAKDPTTSIRDMVSLWITRELGLTDTDVIDVFEKVLINSTRTIREMFYIGPYAELRKEPWFPSGNVIQDDLLDAEAAFRVVQQLPANVLDTLVHEKHQAEVRLEEDIAAIRSLSQKLGNKGEEMIRSLEYGVSLAKTLHRLLSALVGYRRFRSTKDPAHRKLVEQMCDKCQQHWASHQRIASHVKTATAFRSDNLYDVLQRIVDDMHARDTTTV